MGSFMHLCSCVLNHETLVNVFKTGQIIPTTENKQTNKPVFTLVTTPSIVLFPRKERPQMWNSQINLNIFAQQLWVKMMMPFVVPFPVNDVNDDFRNPGDFFYMKDESGRLSYKIQNNSFFVIFLWYIFKYDDNKSRDMVQKDWKCIFDFSLTVCLTVLLSSR